MKAESCQEGRVTHYPSDWSPPSKTQNKTQTNTHIQLAAAIRNLSTDLHLNSLSPFPAFVNFFHTLLPSFSCLSFVCNTAFIWTDEIHYRSLVKLRGKTPAVQNELTFWLILMVSVWRMYGQRRWDEVETGEGSNTTITMQLISIGVTKRISVTPSMFTQPGGESSKKEQERGESDIF